MSTADRFATLRAGLTDPALDAESRAALLALLTRLDAIPAVAPARLPSPPAAYLAPSPWARCPACQDAGYNGCYHP